MASGRIVPASKSFGAQKQKLKKFLVVIQHYNGDVEDAEALASLIADLERTRNREADVMLFRRADSREMSASVRAKLESKFDRVILQACRRSDAKGYPFGANQMWSDLVMLMAQVPPFATDYYAFINLEADVVPLRPGWISELITAWKSAHATGKAAIGHIHDNPVNHLNGLAVYSADLFRRVASNKLMGGSPTTCYDIYFANFLRPHALDSNLIAFSYRKPTITAEELYATQKNGEAPALYHGVKDGSARAAVRARHITFTQPVPVAPPLVSVPQSTRISDSPVVSMAGSPPTKPAPVAPVAPPAPGKRPNVYCYHQPATKANADEQHAIQAIWRKAWTSRGWNPVVLTLREAARNPRFEAFQDRLEKLPYIGGKKESFNRFNRWLALEMEKGGLMVDVDVLPGAFTPADLIRNDVGLVLSPRDSQGITAAVFDFPNLVQFIQEIELYDARPEDTVDGRACVTDMTVWLAHHGDAVEPTVVEAGSEAGCSTKLVRFSGTADTGLRRSEVMERFLSNETVTV
jgi:hypothetical protein